MFEFFQEHKLLTFTVIVIALTWIYFTYRNFLAAKYNTFESEYQKVISSAKHKVKGKFE